MQGLIDTHCHLTGERFAQDRDEVVRRAQEAGLIKAMTIGTGIADARACLDLADTYGPWLACSAGVRKILLRYSSSAWRSCCC